MELSGRDRSWLVGRFGQVERIPPGSWHAPAPRSTLRPLRQPCSGIASEELTHPRSRDRAWPPDASTRGRRGAGRGEDAGVETDPTSARRRWREWRCPRRSRLCAPLLLATSTCPRATRSPPVLARRRRELPLTAVEEVNEVIGMRMHVRAFPRLHAHLEHPHPLVLEHHLVDVGRDLRLRLRPSLLPSGRGTVIQPRHQTCVELALGGPDVAIAANSRLIQPPSCTSSLSQVCEQKGACASMSEVGGGGCPSPVSRGVCRSHIRGGGPVPHRDGIRLVHLGQATGRRKSTPG